MFVDYGKWDLSSKDIVVLTFCSLSAGLAVGWLFYDSLRIASALTLTGFLMVPYYKKRQIEQRRQVLLLQFRDVLYSIASSVSVGRSMGQALEESITFWNGTYSDDDLIIRELRVMVRCMKESNTSDVDVLKDFARRSGLTDVSDFAGVYESCKGSGANLVQAVNRAAMVIGDRITLERELKTLMAQKKFESRIVMGSPFAVLLFLKILSPEYLLPLTATSQGRMISTAALFLIGLACLMMERVNRFEF